MWIKIEKKYVTRMILMYFWLKFEKNPFLWKWFYTHGESLRVTTKKSKLASAGRQQGLISVV